MGAANFKKSVEGFLQRFEVNVKHRKYLDTKPHAVIISKEYLQAVGLSDAAIAKVHTKVRAYVAGLAKRNPSSAYFREDTGVAYFLSSGKDSNFSRAKYVRQIVSNASRDIDKSDLVFETGHTLTANVTEGAYTKLQRLRNTGAKQSIFAAYQKAVTNYRNSVIAAFSETYKININVEQIKTQLPRQTDSKFLVVITPQTREFNQEILNPLERAFKSEFNGDVIALLKGSPSMIEMLYDSLKRSFLGLKVITTTYSNKVKASIIPKVGKSVITPDLKDARKITDNVNVLNLKNLINLKLHDQIKRNMGKGYSKEILNYQSGRFARSAEAQTILVNRQDYLDIYYTYQRYPYDTFLPWGRLGGKPGRDPRNIIGNSIRQLATQLVSNNFKVNPILR